MNNATHWRYRRFAAEFFVDGDAPAAYKRAGFKARTPAAVYTNVSRVLRNAEVQRYLAEEFARLKAAMALDQDRHAQEVCALAYSDLGDVCTWGPEGVTLHPSDAIPTQARSAIQSVKRVTKTRLVEQEDGTVVPETETRTEVTMHPKVPALTLLQTMFDRGQTVRQHLEGKLHQLAGLAAKFIPVERHGEYFAAVRMVMGDGGRPVFRAPDAADE